MAAMAGIGATYRLWNRDLVGTVPGKSAKAMLLIQKFVPARAQSELFFFCIQMCNLSSLRRNL